MVEKEERRKERSLVGTYNKPYKKLFHNVLPTAILFFYFISLMVVILIALILLPLTTINWLLHKKEMKWYDAAPSFPLLERYWKILAEK